LIRHLTRELGLPASTVSRAVSGDLLLHTFADHVMMIDTMLHALLPFIAPWRSTEIHGALPQKLSDIAILDRASSWDIRGISSAAQQPSCVLLHEMVQDAKTRAPVVSACC
jgi:hypothetical protein